MKDFYNGCSDPRTLELYRKFENNPHCHTFQMTRSEDAQETLFIGFYHYKDDFTAKFNTSTGVAELFIYVKWEDECNMEYYGIITSDKLLSLLDSIPHVVNFLEVK